MSNIERDLYAHPLVGLGYDVLVRLVFASVGGVDALREQALDAMSLAPGMSVLELGCGTGSITAKLLARGAAVTAVDRSVAMLARARRRAPLATFVEHEISSFSPGRTFDRVVLAFVLHELDEPPRRRTLEHVRAALGPGGRVCILDHALPKAGLAPRAVSAFVHSFEPESTRDWLREGYVREIEAAGLSVVSDVRLASGTAALLIAR
jgi:ubiquinone/menaquinone biosynthesis C-methylase UbiE